MANIPKKGPTPITGDSRWKVIGNSKEFKHLVAIKRTFIVPAFLLFIAYYFALAVLVGYLPKLASARVIGTVTFGYLFALSQFVFGAMIAALYLLAASRFDALTDDLLAQADEQQAGQ